MPASPDARLLEIAEEFFRLKARSDAIYATLQSLEEERAVEKEDEKRVARMDELDTEAEAITPNTSEGFAAKARLAEYWLRFHHSVEGEVDGSVVMAVRLCRDLQGRAAA